MFAADNDVKANAVRELRRAAGCLLGYGWRKDLFAWEVIESLDLLGTHGDSQAKETLLALAGEFTSITTYTDGDETGSVREDYYRMLARAFPERIPNCYSQLVQQEEWHYAQILATTMVALGDLESPTGFALLSTYILPSEIRTLESQDIIERPYAAAALDTVRRRTGRSVRPPRATGDSAPASPMAETNTTVSSADVDAVKPDPAEFPPGRIREYLTAGRNSDTYTDQSERCAEWLRYWGSAGKADEALSDLESLISDRRSFSLFGSALDAAFEISLAAQGRSTAFRWLCLAHVANHGWEEWYSSREEARTRMRTAAQHYPRQWREFVVNTARERIETRSERNGIAVGLSRLVYFLLQVGLAEEAQTYTREIVQIFRDELTEQPISVPTWSR